MKKNLLFLLVLVLCGMMQRVDAKPVSLQQARKVAVSFLRQQGVAQPRLTDLTAQTPFHEFYTFAIDGGGFILIAGDDATVPVLGFSTENDVFVEQMPDHVASWLRTYDELVAYNRQQGLGTHGYWEILGAGGEQPDVYSTSVSPLLTTLWDQSPYYNNLCPYDNTYNDRTVTGCVATATAQVMKYWNHPTTGYGTHSYTDNGYNGVSYGSLSANFGNTTYQWSSMPNSLSSSSTSTQVSAVATLMYHIGVADEMTYGVAATGGSGAQNHSYDGQYSTPSSQNSLIEYFKYAPNMNIVDRTRFSSSEFCDLLSADLDQSHPILYSGRDATGGHSFVIDGYNNQGQFHINWGWGGYYNGYFYIGALNPGASGTGGTATGQYNLKNVALTNIHPNNSWGTTASTTVTTSAVGSGTVTGAGVYSFGNVVQLNATATGGNRFAYWNDGGSCASISFKATGGSYSYQAHFESIVDNDTISYCGNGSYVLSYGTTSGNETYWGMRIPAGVGAGSTLSAVQLYVPSAGSYTIYVYEGTSTFSDVIYSATQSFTTTGWHTITLPVGHTIDPTKSLWIAFSSTAGYPAAVTAYSGNTYSALWGQYLTELNQPYTFMIRAITGSGTGTGGGDTVDVSGNCEWYDNLLASDEPYYIWYQDHTNSIYNYAEKFTNTDTLIVDSIGFAPNTVSGTGSIVVTLCPATSAGSPGTAVSTLTIPYSQIVEGYWNNFALTAPAQVTGDYFVCFALNSSPTTDTLALLSSGMRTPNTAWAQYGGTWYEVSNLYQGVSGISLYAQVHGCVAEADTTTDTVVDCNPVALPYACGFENISDFQCWQALDQDGDGYSWQRLDTWGDATSDNGTALASASYINGVGALTPDNWAVSPQIVIPEGGATLMWRVNSTDEDYYAEHYSVMLSPTGGNSVSDFTTQLYTETLTSDNWHLRSVNITTPGTVRIAFRHHNCTDMFWLLIDDVSIVAGTGGGDTVDVSGNCEWYDNLLASDEPYYIWYQDHTNSIYNYAEKFTNTDTLIVDSIGFAPNTVSGTGSIVVTLCPATSAGSPGTAVSTLTIPYSQIVEGYWNSFALTAPAQVTGDYFVCFALNSSPTTDTLALLSTGMRTPNTAWAQYGGTWYEVSNLYQGVSGISLYAQAHGCVAEADTTTDTVVDCNPVALPYACGFENVSDFQCWQALDQDGDGYSWQRLDTWGDATSSNGTALASASYINGVGALTPDNWAVSPQIVIPEGGATLMWRVNSTDEDYYAEHYSVMLSPTGGNSVSDFTTQLYTETLTSDNWHLRSVNITTPGTVRIAFRHHNCTDMFWLLIDDVSIVAGTGAGDSIADSENCDWFDNLHNSDEPYYIWYQDHTNNIYNYAEKFTNTDTIVVDSIGFAPNTVSGTGSIVVTLCPATSAGSPGTAVSTLTIPYSQIVEGYWNSFALTAPAQVTGDYFVCFSLNSSPATDTLAILSTGMRTPNTAWARYGGTWYEVSNLYQGVTGLSLYVKAHGCVAEADTTTDTVVVCNPVTLPYACGFENAAELQCWQALDQDGDGYSWQCLSNWGDATSDNGTALASASYVNNIGALTPDNWAVSPQIVIPEGGATLVWQVKATDANDYAEHYSVMLSPTGGDDAADFTTQLYAETLTGNSWQQRSVNITTPGTVRIAFRHHNCTNMYWLLIDDVSITAGTGTGDDTISDQGECGWYHNLLANDEPYYIWYQDHINSVYNYAEKFTNNGDRTVDSISFAPYIVSGTGSIVVTLCPATAAGEPGTAVSTLTIPYSQLVEGDWNSFALSAPAQVTGDYFVCFALNSSPATDTLALFSTDMRAPNTAWAQYGGTWYEVSNLYQGVSGISLYVQAHSCPTADTTTPPAQYFITVVSNNDAWGTVSGGGTYDDGASCTITATPNDGYHFVSWQDGDTQNPRTFVVTCDATYEATFDVDAGIGDVEDGAQVLSTQYFDVLGRRLAKEPDHGVYLIRTVTTKGAFTQKKVKR